MVLRRGWLIAGFIVGIFYITSGYALDGKDIFLVKCGVCHQGGKEVSAFAPTKYATTQWERFFKRNKHKRKKDISHLFTQDEWQAVKEYLVNHAADSDQPEAVGLR